MKKIIMVHYNQLLLQWVSQLHSCSAASELDVRAHEPPAAFWLEFTSAGTTAGSYSADPWSTSDKGHCKTKLAGASCLAATQVFY